MLLIDSGATLEYNQSKRFILADSVAQRWIYCPLGAERRLLQMIIFSWLPPTSESLALARYPGKQLEPLHGVSMVLARR